MTTTQQIMMVGAGVVATMLTRFVPFLVIRPGKPTPKMVQYLGKVLPASVFALLVVYCLRGISFAEKEMPVVGDVAVAWRWSLTADTIAQLAAVAATAFIHAWRKNMMVSIAVGTVCYMILIRVL